jgi:hypothetical protein
MARLPQPYCRSRATPLPFRVTESIKAHDSRAPGSSKNSRTSQPTRRAEPAATTRASATNQPGTERASSRLRRPRRCPARLLTASMSSHNAARQRTYSLANAAYDAADHGGRCHPNASVAVGEGDRRHHRPDAARDRGGRPITSPRVRHDRAMVDPTAAQLHSEVPRIPASAGALIFDDRGRLLVLKPSYKKHWTIPGGQIEPDGESPWDTCWREARGARRVRARGPAGQARVRRLPETEA